MSRRWEEQEIKMIKDMVHKNFSTKEIGEAINRTEAAVRVKASREHISLIPKNR